MAAHGDDAEFMAGSMLAKMVEEAVADQAAWDDGTRLAEAFRVVRFGDMETLFQEFSEPLEPE